MENDRGVGNSAFIKRRGRGCRKDRPAAATLLQDTVEKGVCLRCAGQQTDHPQEKKNGFDEMQMSTFTQNLPPHLSPRSPPS